MMEEALVFAPGWHRKWLLLLAALFALFLSRYRVMGALVSALATHQLRKRAPQLQLDVHVRLVLLRPLQFVHVEITCGSDWTLLFTRITVHSRVKEFFRSFGQTKIWALEIEDVIGDVRALDERLLRELLQQHHQQCTNNAVASSTTGSSSSSNQRTSMDPLALIVQPVLTALTASAS